MLFVAQYDHFADVVVDARDDEHAIEVLKLHGIEGEPTALRIVPAGVFVAELFFASEDPSDGSQNPANHSDVGIVFEPSQAAAEWIATMPSACDSEPDVTVVAPDEENDGGAADGTDG